MYWNCVCARRQCCVYYAGVGVSGVHNSVAAAVSALHNSVSVGVSCLVIHCTAVWFQGAFQNGTGIVVSALVIPYTAVCSLDAVVGVLTCAA